MIKNLVFFILVCAILLINSLVTFGEEIQTQQNPKPASASVYNLGLKSYEQNDTDSAITFFKQAIDLDPEFVDAYFNLGAIYKKQKKYFNAIEAFKKVVELSPKDLEAVYELASCYFSIKDYSNAKNYYSLIPKGFEKHEEAQRNLDKIEREIALQNIDKDTSTEVVKSDEVQAQLLVNKLERIVETKEVIKDRFKTVSNKLNGPAGITKDSKNNIYIANFTKDSIERITPEGVKEVFIEQIGIKGPLGLAADENNNLYVANYVGDSIVKITPDRTLSVVVDKIVKPYYLFYDLTTSSLYATVQGDNSLIEISLKNIVSQPITSR